MSSYGKKRYKEVIYFSLQRHDVEEKEANLKSRLFFFFLALKKKCLGDKEGNDYIYQELNLINYESHTANNQLIFKTLVLDVTQ
jgi:hypothetical protein